MTRAEPEHRLLLQWLLFTVTLVFLLWLAWDHGLLQQVYRNDPTRLSLLITALFVSASIHCALRCRFLSVQLNRMREIRHRTETGRAPLLVDGRLILNGVSIPASLPAAYLQAILEKYRVPGRAEWQLEHAQLTEVLAEQAHGQHEIGWFLTGLLVKLGLLGTVIGFVLMLGSVSEIQSFDVTDVQNVLKNMTVGMGVALNTTLVGLTGSMLLSCQYLLLDRGADRLVAETVSYAETRLLAAPDAGGA